MAQEQQAVDVCLGLMSPEDRTDLLELLKTPRPEVEEWKRSYLPMPEYRGEYSHIEFHVIGQEVYCSYLYNDKQVQI